MSMRHPIKDVNQRAVYLELKLRGEDCVRNIRLKVIVTYVVFKALEQMITKNMKVEFRREHNPETTQNLEDSFRRRLYKGG